MKYFSLLLIVLCLGACQTKDNEQKISTDSTKVTLTPMPSVKETEANQVEELPSIPYKAVILYHHKPESEADWEFFATDITDALSKNGVMIINAENLGEIDIKVGEQTADKIKLKAYFQAHNKGYLFAQNGKVPEFCPYDVSDITIQKAEDYFNRNAE